MKNVLYVLLILISVNIAKAEEKFVARIPNGAKNSCMNCHFSLDGGSRNVFGNAFKSAGERWNKTLSQIDSDKDGFTNGLELQDSAGVWTTAKGPTSGDPSKVTLPGNINDFPSGIEDFSNEMISIAYPNPTFENTTFEISNLSANGLEVNTYDMSGNLVKTEKINSNGTFNYIWNKTNSQNQSLPQGIYILEFITDKININRKVVLE